MKILFKNLFIKLFILINFFLFTYSFADNHNINEVLEQLQNDIKTLEKAVYSGSMQLDNDNLNLSSNNNSEDVLTRHLLKLAELENQFQQLIFKELLKK